MSRDPSIPPTHDRPWYQFSLSTMLLITVYVAVLGKVCTVLYWFRLKDAPLWFLVFYFTWTALILAQLASALWAWWWLGKLGTAGQVPVGGGFSGSDSREPLKPDQRRWRFRIALAWAAVPLVLWITFTAALGERDAWVVAVFCIILLHLLPLMLVNAIQYLVRQRRKDDAPLRAMRLSGIAGFMLPAVVLPVHWMLGL